MFALATPERPALYFTVLGEPPLKMLRYQQQFEFFDAREINRSVRFNNLSDVMMSGNLDLVLKRIVLEVQQAGPGLVFVDSFRSVALAAVSDGQSISTLQHFVQQIGIHMTSWQATTLLIGEYFDENDANPVCTVADGLIWLRQSVERNSVVRKIKVMKMRGQPTLSGLHSFRITNAGLTVFAPAMPSLGRDASMPADLPRLSLGVPGLGAMLGGGLPSGHSLLVAGPSGSGRTILAAAFLAAGARLGEKGVLVSFEQNPNQSSSRGLADLIVAGSVSLLDPRSPDLSIDEILLLMISEIRRLGASRVVLDSLSGFELALAPTFRADYRESMARTLNGPMSSRSWRS